MIDMCAVLQVCKLLGNNGSKSHEMSKVARLNNVGWHFEKKVKVVQTLLLLLFLLFVLLYQIAKSMMKMSSYNCDQSSVFRATVVFLMQVCSHALG